VTRVKPPGRVLEIAVLVFLYAPIFVMTALSFNVEKSRSHWGGFSLRWYKSLFTDDLVLSSLYTTLLVALLSAAIAAIAGTAAAIGLYSMRAKPRRLMLAVNNIPVVNPDIITGVSLMLVFVIFTGWLRRVGIAAELGFGTLLAAHITFNIPYVILSVLPRLRSLSRNVYEAALDLGATPAAAYRKVILPEIMPGVLSGFIIAVTMSIDDFLISYFTAGSKVQTLPMTIYAMTRKRVSPEINALSTLLFVSVLLLLVAVNLISAREKKKEKRRG